MMGLQAICIRRRCRSKYEWNTHSRTHTHPLPYHALSRTFTRTHAHTHSSLKQVHALREQLSGGKNSFLKYSDVVVSNVTLNVGKCRHK